MIDEKGTLLYDESNKSRLTKSYIYFIPQLGVSLLVFILGYMAIMSSSPLLGIGLILIGMCIIVFVWWLKNLPYAQVYSTGIIFPSPPFLELIRGNVFVPYSEIKTIIWIKKGMKNYLEVLFLNNKIRLEVPISDVDKFMEACTPYVRISMEEKSNYDKKKYLSL